jgi:Tubulin-tyrosine ligase family
VYCLVARTAPHYLLYYHSGYARLSLQRYGLDAGSLADPLVHLTNAAMQKKHPDYCKQVRVWPFSSDVLHTVLKSIHSCKS